MTETPQSKRKYLVLGWLVISQMFYVWVFWQWVTNFDLPLLYLEAGHLYGIVVGILLLSYPLGLLVLMYFSWMFYHEGRYSRAAILTLLPGTYVCFWCAMLIAAS